MVGGGDTAMEEATLLTRFAKSVTVVHRRSTLRASMVMQDRAFADDKISFAFDSEIAEIKETNGMLGGVVLRDVLTGATRDLDVTGLFIAIGHDPRTELFTDQLALDAEGYITVASPTTHTSLPGVFAAGDVVDHTYRQAITAAGTGAAAALDAERYLAAGGAAETELATAAVPACVSLAAGVVRKHRAAPSSSSHQPPPGKHVVSSSVLSQAVQRHIRRVSNNLRRYLPTKPRRHRRPVLTRS